MTSALTVAAIARAGQAVHEHRKHSHAEHLRIAQAAKIASEPTPDPATDTK